MRESRRNETTLRRILDSAMHYLSSHAIELPDWQVAPVRRLRVSLLIAATMVAALLSVIRLPELPIAAPLFELVVELARPVQATVEDLPVQEEVPVAPAAHEVAVEDTSLPAESEIDLRDQVRDSTRESSVSTSTAEPSFDWEAAKSNAVQSAVDAMEETVNVNPEFDRRRAAAAIKFRASAAPVKKEIWEAVEKDELGRTLLRKGDCYRVLDDPSAVNRWAFENFGQYITYCANRKYVGKDLEWVKDIHQQFAYLRNRIDRRGGSFVGN